MMPLILLVAAAAACLCIDEVLGGPYRRLAYQRRGESFREFQAPFRRAGVHPDVLFAVQDYFQTMTSVRGFPMRAHDDLLTQYGLQREDVQDAVAVVAANAHCLSLGVLAPDVYAGVTNVEDLVLAVHRLHQQAQRVDISREQRWAAK